jgi:hypothetical protein
MRSRLHFRPSSYTSSMSCIRGTGRALPIEAKQGEPSAPPRSGDHSGQQMSRSRPGAGAQATSSRLGARSDEPQRRGLSVGAATRDLSSRAATTIDAPLAEEPLGGVEVEALQEERGRHCEIARAQACQTVARGGRCQAESGSGGLERAQLHPLETLSWPGNGGAGVWGVPRGFTADKAWLGGGRGAGRADAYPPR